MKMTNGDKIRAMTDKELSKFISDLSISNCGICPAKKECYKNDVNVNSCGEMIQYWLKRKEGYIVEESGKFSIGNVVQIKTVTECQPAESIGRIGIITDIIDDGAGVMIHTVRFGKPVNSWHEWDYVSKELILVADNIGVYNLMAP